MIDAAFVAAIAGLKEEATSPRCYGNNLTGELVLIHGGKVIHTLPPPAQPRCVNAHVFDLDQIAKVSELHSDTHWLGLDWRGLHLRPIKGSVGAEEWAWLFQHSWAWSALTDGIECDHATFVTKYLTRFAQAGVITRDQFSEWSKRRTSRDENDTVATRTTEEVRALANGPWQQFLMNPFQNVAVQVPLTVYISMERSCSIKVEKEDRADCLTKFLRQFHEFLSDKLTVPVFYA